MKAYSTDQTKIQISLKRKNSLSYLKSICTAMLCQIATVNVAFLLFKCS